jgi:prolipoprotein diacylglyceryltransferase
LGYCIGRIGIEAIRIDQAHEIFGLRLNIWVGLFVAIGALISFRHLNKGGPELLG